MSLSIQLQRLIDVPAVVCTLRKQTPDGDVVKLFRLTCTDEAMPALRAFAVGLEQHLADVEQHAALPLAERQRIEAERAANFAAMIADQGEGAEA